MARLRPIKTNFTNGEVDPLITMRSDLELFVNGASKIRNAIPFPQGGFRRRDGLEFMTAIPPASDNLQIVNAGIDDGGTGYTVSDTLTIVSGTGTAATLNVDTVVSGVITAVSIVTSGIYTVAPTSPDSPTGGTGTGASITFNIISIAQVVPIGIVDIGITTPGTAYVVGDNLTLTGGTGTSAQLRVESVSAGVITGIILIDAGDYTVAPTSPAGHTGGTGTGATFSFTEETQDIVFPVDFTFAVDQNYLIVFTLSRFYIFRKEDTGSGIDQLVEQGLHPYSNDELENITWTQSLDVMLVFHNNHPIFQLTRTAETTWTWDTFTITNPPSFAFNVTQTVNLTSITQPTNVGDVVTITAAGAAFTAADVGKFIRVFGTVDTTGENRSSFFKISAFTSTVIVSAEALVLPLVTATFSANAVEWLLEEPEWSQARGYPSCGTFFQGRLSVAGSQQRPNTFWASRAGDINDFNNGGVADDLGIAITSDAGDVSSFQNIYPGRHLQLFADSAEFYIPVSDAEPITPTTAALRRTTSVGSVSGIPVFEVDGVVYFIQRGGESLRQFVFEDSSRAYAADIVSLFSSHLIRNPRDAAFKKSLNTEDGNFIWVVNRDDGSLAAFGLLRSELINAWSLQTTEGDFHHVAVLGQTTYFHTVRTIDSATVDYIEFFNADLRFDAGVIQTALASPVTEVTGLQFLEGESVSVIVDDIVFANQTVTDGIITLPEEAQDSFQLGIAFPDIEGEEAGTNVLVQTLPADILLATGSRMGKKKRVVTCTVRFVDTQGFYLQGIQVGFRNLPAVLDVAIPKQTGDKELKGLLGWNVLGQIKITQKEPLAMTILGMAYDLSTG